MLDMQEGHFSTCLTCRRATSNAFCCASLRWYMTLTGQTPQPALQNLAVHHTLQHMMWLFTTLVSHHHHHCCAAGKPPEPGDAPGSNARSVLTQRLAAKVTERTMVMQRAGQLPGRETCDLIILDRWVRFGCFFDRKPSCGVASLQTCLSLSAMVVVHSAVVFTCITMVCFIALKGLLAQPHVLWFE